MIHLTNVLLLAPKQYFFSQNYTSYNKILLNRLFWFPPLHFLFFSFDHQEDQFPKHSRDTVPQRRFPRHAPVEGLRGQHRDPSHRPDGEHGHRGRPGGVPQHGKHGQALGALEREAVRPLARRLSTPRWCTFHSGRGLTWWDSSLRSGWCSSTRQSPMSTTPMCPLGSKLWIIELKVLWDRVL